MIHYLVTSPMKEYDYAGPQRSLYFGPERECALVLCAQFNAQVHQLDLTCNSMTKLRCYGGCEFCDPEHINEENQP